MPSYAPPFWVASSVSFYYGKVRYLYKRSGGSITMSQILQTKPGSGLYQDLFFAEKKSNFASNAHEATCYVCGKGIQHGLSITAKKFATGTLLFCEKHYSM